MRTRAWVRVAWVLGGLAACGLVFVLSFWAAMKLEMRSTEVSVPDLVGKTSEEAARAAAEWGLPVEVVDRRHDAERSSGRVLDQEPAAGSSVRRGRRIKLVLSLGGRILEVPPIVGKGSRVVEMELTRAGFLAGSEARVGSLDAPAGTVLAQVPPAGSPAVPGSRIHRLVSDGPPPRAWVMPDLTGRARSEVERWIDLCGFRRGAVRTVGAADATSATVVGQLPLAGHPVRPREIVEITVAR